MNQESGGKEDILKAVRNVLHFSVPLVWLLCKFFILPKLNSVDCLFAFLKKEHDSSFTLASLMNFYTVKPSKFPSNVMYTQLHNRNFYPTVPT